MKTVKDVLVALMRLPQDAIIIREDPDTGSLEPWEPDYWLTRAIVEETRSGDKFVQWTNREQPDEEPQPVPPGLRLVDAVSIS